MSVQAQRGLGVALGGLILAALGAMLLRDFSGWNDISEPVRGALLGGLAASAATALGATSALLLAAVPSAALRRAARAA